MKTTPLVAVTGFAAALMIGTSTRLEAQSPINPWGAHATELGVFVGGASAGDGIRPVVGGTASWELSRWVTIESRGDWFDRGNGANAFDAYIGTQVNVVPRQTITPFVAARFGLYHASFDTNRAAMPAFYDRRGGDAASPNRRHTFTDPAFVLGAGVDWLMKRTIVIRPEAAIAIVRGGGRSEAITTFGLRVAYRFENRAVTPARP